MKVIYFYSHSSTQQRNRNHSVCKRLKVPIQLGMQDLLCYKNEKNNLILENNFLVHIQIVIAF